MVLCWRVLLHYHNMANIPPTISDNARRLLGFVHVVLERDRVAPTRQEMAEYLGFADKKSLLPILGELTAAGWRRERGGHRSDDWGGVYARPASPPFVVDGRVLPNPQMGDGEAWQQAGLIA
jgi:hypothetical protein